VTLRIYNTDLTATAGVPQVTGSIKWGTTEVTAAKGGQSLTLSLTIVGTFVGTTATIRSGGPAGATLTGSGPWTLVVPYFSTDQDDVVVDATVTYSGGSVPYVFVVTVYPHVSWWLDSTGTWKPRKNAVKI
jgi:hypothetical protein